MKTRQLVSRLLAVIGTLLVWIPVVAPLLFALSRAARGAGFRYDYLLPAEIFPLSLVGAGLLIAAALLLHQRLLPILLPAGLMMALFGLVIWTAQATGLADGRVAMGGWQEYLVTGLLGLFSLVGVALAVFAVRLSAAVWQRQPAAG
jgi:hypothetical protein